MKKVLKTMVVAACFIPALSFAASQTTTVEKVKAAIGPTTTQAQIHNNQITVISPRTGISYTFPNQNKTLVLQTQAVAAANAVSVERIVAANPALSVESQQQAKQALLAAAQ